MLERTKDSPLVKNQKFPWRPNPNSNPNPNPKPNPNPNLNPNPNPHPNPNPNPNPTQVRSKDTRLTESVTRLLAEACK